MPTDAEVVSFFHRHVVYLVFTFQKGSDKQNLAVTAFVLSVLDKWFLITAGHCIQQIETMTEQLGFKLTQCQLIDSLGLGASHYETIPFTYSHSHPRCLSDDYAFDYGVMDLSLYYRHLLEANNVQALNENSWKIQPTIIDLYMLLGIPSELVKVDSENITLGLTLLRVEPVDEKPPGFTDVEYPLFYGRIKLGEGLTSIKGMSGGPIFAFRQIENGGSQYWLTALQSRWLQNSQDIAACPTKLLGNFLEFEIIKTTKRER